MARENIEGSAERAADRGQALGLEDFTINIAAGGSLGNPDDVERIVREFCSGVVDVRKRWNEGATEEASTSALTDLVERFALIFNGRDTAYTASPWNSPAMLGRSLNRRLALDGPEEAAAGALFWHLANQMLETASGMETGELADDVAKFRADVDIETAVYMLMGLPLQKGLTAPLAKHSMLCQSLSST